MLFIYLFRFIFFIFVPFASTASFRYMTFYNSHFYVRCQVHMLHRETRTNSLVYAHGSLPFCLFQTVVEEIENLDDESAKVSASEDVDSIEKDVRTSV